MVRMLAVPKYGFVVLAVPKSGSTALEAAFTKHAQLVTSGPPSLKHVTAREFDERFVPLLEQHGYARADYEVTALVREPVSWLASWWRYRSRPGIAGKRTYVGDLGFDEVVGHDDLDSAFEWMRAKVGKNKIKLPQRNVSPPREHEVTAATRDLIEEAYAADLTLYRSLG